MRKYIIIMMVLAVAGFAAAEELGVSATIDAASAYVFRGSTFNDGMVLQPGAEIALGDFSIGTWANFDLDDYNGSLDDNEFSEVDIFGSYALPVESLDVSLGYCAYIYPLDSTDADHEVSLTVGFDLPLAPSVSLNYGVDGGIEDSLYVEFGIGQEFELCEDLGAELGVAIGYLEADAGESGFSHADISAALSYKAVSCSLTYVAEIDDDVLGESYDTEVVAVIGSGLEF